MQPSSIFFQSFFSNVDRNFLTRIISTMKLFFLLGILLVGISKVKAEKSCKEFITHASDKLLQSFFDCKKEMTFKSEDDKLSKMHCILVCAMKKEKFLSADGYVDEASVLAYVENEIPKSIQDAAIQLMLKCQEHGSNLDPEQEQCLSYGGLIKCAMTVLFKICNP